MFTNSTDESRLTLAKALMSFKKAFVGVGLMTGVINILALTGSFFMLQVYDRVIPSKSLPTLVGLMLLAGTMFAFQGVLELIRSRLMVRLGSALDGQMSGQVYSALMRLPLRTKINGDGLQPLRDLDQVRSFMSSAGPTALFDLPWMPLYIGICFLFHFWIGMAALVGAIILFTLTLLAEARTKGPMKIAGQHAQGRQALAEATRRNNEALQAMGFGERMGDRWSAINAEYLASHARASDVSGTLGTISRILRLMLQSGILAIGAYLVVLGQATGGIMIAASIMTSRALAPIELAIAHWKGFVSARQSWSRLKQFLGMLPQSVVSVDLEDPKETLAVENVTIVPPGDRKFVVQEASFSLTKGAGLGVIGPSASGKSSLARAIAGVWVPARGTVRLDGATLDQWTPEALGPHIGYLPQDVQLFDGTIAENIARFEPDAPSEKILRAAMAAGVHELIVRLPDGYDTRIGEAGNAISAGQRQRVALARALYGDPFLVILDEPNSNLDAEGEEALTGAIQGVRNRGGIAVVVAHRPSALASVDQVLVMAGGRVQAFGPKNEVLGKVLRPAPVPTQPAPRQAPMQVPLKVVGTEEGTA